MRAKTAIFNVYAEISSSNGDEYEDGRFMSTIEHGSSGVRSSSHIHYAAVQGACIGLTYIYTHTYIHTCMHAYIHIHTYI
jgi:hypothetical protein